MTTKVIELKDTDGNILLPHAYSASHDNNGDAFSSVYATITTVNTKADDSAVVHLSGNEVITGIKTFTDTRPIILKSNDYVVNTFTDNYNMGQIEWRDKNSTAICYLKTYSSTDGKIWNEFAGNYGTNAWKLGLKVGYDSVADEMFTQAPTPSSASDNSRKIATTEWVNSHNAIDTNLVHRSGDEFVAGMKTFTHGGVTIRFKNNDVEQLTIPAAYSEQMVFGVDQNDVRIGSLGIAMTDDARSRCYIASSKYVNGEYVYNCLENYVDVNGNFSTYVEGQRLRAWVRETYISGTYWYRVYSDGWIEQGGITTVGAETTVTLPRAFSNTNYTAVCNPCDQATNATSDNNYEAHIKSRSTTGFNIKFWDSDSTSSRNGNVAWLAFGY